VDNHLLLFGKGHIFRLYPQGRRFLSSFPPRLSLKSKYRPQPVDNFVDID